MVAARRGLWFSLLVCALMLLKVQGYSVPITYVENGVAEGAGRSVHSYSSFVIFYYCALYLFNV